MYNPLVRLEELIRLEDLESMKYKVEEGDSESYNHDAVYKKRTYGR